MGPAAGEGALGNAQVKARPNDLRSWLPVIGKLTCVRTARRLSSASQARSSGNGGPSGRRSVTSSPGRTSPLADTAVMRAFFTTR